MSVKKRKSYSLVTGHIFLLLSVEGVTMVTMPVDFCPSPLVVELPPLLGSEGVVAK